MRAGSAAEDRVLPHRVTLDSRVQATLITSVGTQGFLGGAREQGGRVCQRIRLQCGMTTGPGVGQEGWEVKKKMAGT